MIELKITLDQSGLRVEGPIQDKLVCLGLLELAKDAVKEFKASPIITSPPLPQLGVSH